YPIQYWRHGLYLPNHWSLDMGPRWLAGGHELSRFRRLNGCPHDRWRDCAWSTAWPRLQARWRWAAAAARPDHWRGGWLDPVVWLVWLQPRQHVVGTGYSRYRARCLQHDAGRVLGWYGG